MSVAEWTSSTSLTAIVPSLRVGIHSVDVSLDGVMFSSTIAELKVEKGFVVRAVHPSTSRLSGGKLVEVKTRGIETSAKVHCLFGSAFSEATVMESLIVLCRTPKHVVAEDLRVGLQVGELRVWGQDAFVRYEDVEPASLMSIYPSAGPMEGGTTIQLRATGLPTGSTEIGRAHV